MTPDAPDRTAEVLRLAYVVGLGIRTIARRLSMARKTVRKLLGRAPKQLAPPAPRGSILDPHLPAIRRMLEETPELTAPAVLERLRPLGYTGGVSILRDRMREIRPRLQREAFLTLDFRPGQAVQVDLADFGYAIPGCPRRVSAFVMALCYSRYLYVEFALSQTMGSFLRCMERGLTFYGGVTFADIFDNMKTVVLSPRPGATGRVRSEALSVEHEALPVHPVSQVARHADGDGDLLGSHRGGAGGEVFGSALGHRGLALGCAPHSTHSRCTNDANLIRAGTCQAPRRPSG